MFLLLILSLVQRAILSGDIFDKFKIMRSSRHLNFLETMIESSELGFAKRP